MNPRLLLIEAAQAEVEVRRRKVEEAKALYEECYWYMCEVFGALIENGVMGELTAGKQIRSLCHKFSLIVLNASRWEGPAIRQMILLGQPATVGTVETQKPDVCN